MMSQMRKLLLILLLVLAHAGFVSAAMARDVVVFAAASLKNALDDASAAYEKEAGVKALISYAASSTLAKQIESGAPADLFISADLDWMDYLQKQNLIEPGTRLTLVGNKLVLIAPASSRSKIEIAPGFALADLLGNERLAMADPSAVPAGRYAKAALERLGVWASVWSKVAPAADVRSALLRAAGFHLQALVRIGAVNAAARAVISASSASTSLTSRESNQNSGSRAPQRFDLSSPPVRSCRNNGAERRRTMRSASFSIAR